nr:CHAT domain-containing protein [uncultured bacterium]
MLKACCGKKIILVLGVLTLGLGAAYLYLISPHHSSAPPESADGLLQRADTLAWGNRWTDAQPFFLKAEQLFTQQHKPSEALYAKVSQIPPDESGSIPAKVLGLTQDLEKPEAREPETRLRILTIRGMLETNYDAAQARSTWEEVKKLALQRGHFELASRAEGEQGIAAFLLGDTNTAKKQVVTAWGLSKVEHDPAATVRYASVFGAGLVQLHRFKEALTPLDQAISIATSNPSLAYPTIAIYAKIDALAGLKKYDSALELANTSLTRLQGTRYEQHKSQVYLSRGSIHRDMGNWEAAISDYRNAITLSESTDNYRGITDAGGFLAQAYEHENDLPSALSAINSAIAANTHIADELYLVPRNLAIKAEITEKMGHAKEADTLYRKGVALVDVMIQHAATTNIERYLLAEMSNVYSGYFSSLCNQKRYDEALQMLERVRGRIETEALEHHTSQPAHLPTQEERELTRLNVALINTDDPEKRAAITSTIYTTELKMSSSALTQQTIEHPVELTELQRGLSTDTLLIEYVLAEPSSYALAITREKVTPYRLPARRTIEADANRYRNEIHDKKEDRELAQHLFSELLQPIEDYKEKTDLVIIPDGSLHLLPFSALDDGSGYVEKSHTVDVAPSSTVYELLARRSESKETVVMPYIGVAAWTQSADSRNPIVRAINGPARSQFVPLPNSKREVETIAGDLPHPSTILLGAEATEARFKEVSLESSEVIHLALHGYADPDYPDRSALVFAPEPVNSGEDGLLQVREIRRLRLKSKLVTLSACDTGVGPVGDAGIANLVNAFIEAGADTVVSTLWELEDQATEHLMAQFYSHLARHERKVDALRAAKVELLDEGLPPYYWASFQVVGDPNGKL